MSAPWGKAPLTTVLFSYLRNVVTTHVGKAHDSDKILLCLSKFIYE